jgi:hypothetical protein
LGVFLGCGGKFFFRQVSKAGLSPRFFALFIEFAFDKGIVDKLLNEITSLMRRSGFIPVGRLVGGLIFIWLCSYKGVIRFLVTDFKSFGSMAILIKTTMFPDGPRRAV